MIKLTERVTHNGQTYEPGDEIEKIKAQQARRLVDLGVAFFIGNLTLDELSLEEELETVDYNDLKSIAKEVGLDFKGNISKKDLITLIIEEKKAEEVLELAEGDE